MAPNPVWGVTEFWPEAALNAVFKDTPELPFGEFRITAYGKGFAGPSDAPIIEALASIPRMWLRHHGNRQGNVRILELSKPGMCNFGSKSGLSKPGMCSAECKSGSFGRAGPPAKALTS
jgi:hypothetical protein